MLEGWEQCSHGSRPSDHRAPTLRSPCSRGSTIGAPCFHGSTVLLPCEHRGRSGGARRACSNGHPVPALPRFSGARTRTAGEGLARRVGRAGCAPRKTMAAPSPAIKRCSQGVLLRSGRAHRENGVLTAWEHRAPDARAMLHRNSPPREHRTAKELSRAAAKREGGILCSTIS